MNGHTNSPLEDDDALAAELALGTLTGAEASAARARQAHDPRFAAAVAVWEQRLAPLLETVPEVTPDPDGWRRLADRLEDVTTARVRPTVSDSVNVVHLRRQVTRWRLATALCSGLAALLAIWIGTSTMLHAPSNRATYMAVLQQGGAGPAFLVSLDLVGRRMTIVPADTASPPDRSYELWMISAEDPKPHSLGVVDTPMKMALPEMSSDLISKATYAVTIEPKGGSPSGQPTSAPVFSGHLMPMKTQGSP